MKRILIASLIALAGCGSSSDGDGQSAAAPTPTPLNVIALVVSGHDIENDFWGYPQEAYLKHTASAHIRDALVAQDINTQVYNYNDTPFGNEYDEGFEHLSAAMESLSQNLGEFKELGFKLAIIAHSHGGVWAHAAAFQNPEMPIDCFVDIDTSSIHWATGDHVQHNGEIDGDPRNRFSYQDRAQCPGFEDVYSETTDNVDLEDIIPFNVKQSLEIRTYSGAPPSYEMFDERWNIREDGQHERQYCYYTGSESHSDVHSYGSESMFVVSDWLQWCVQQ